jgi:hypothetical protein
MAQKATRLKALEVIALGGCLYLVGEVISHSTANPKPNARFALQAHPPLRAEGKSFYCAGRVEQVDDPEIRQSVRTVAKHYAEGTGSFLS